jgi:Mn2+/Fe2+ NRAMP family transporter
MNHPSSAHPDPYHLDPGNVAEPPRNLLSILRQIGPGIVLAGSIVGSGELIAVPTLGAEVGYTALWIILLSCAIKPLVQAELGRYSLVRGETALAALNRVPGPRWRVGWVVWGWGVMVLLTQLQVGAMYGGLAMVMRLIQPWGEESFWVLLVMALTIGLLWRGAYQRIESLSVVMVALFTASTAAAAWVLTRQPEYFSWAQLSEGLQPRLPKSELVTAMAVFGITGVGATELFAYPYWCLEKGYARNVGPCTDDSAWRRRLEGWNRVMRVDVYFSVLVYTVATLAFYLLGAGILHGKGLSPSQGDMISVLSNLYTQTLGDWARWLFFFGAIAVLYSTIFSATAAHSRMFADMARLTGCFEATDFRSRERYTRGFLLLLTFGPALLYLLVRAPVWMVLAGGVAQSAMLPVIALGTVYLSARHLPDSSRPGWFVRAALWIAALVITAVVGCSFLLSLLKQMG